MTVTIPEGKTWFDVQRRTFSNVQVGADQGVSTTEFLEAAESFTTLFDLLGSAAFSPVKNDMLGNVTKVRERLLSAPAQSETLQALCKSELAEKKHKATEGLLWLVRGLDFTAQALRGDLVANSGVAPDEPKPKQELAASFRAAYNDTLKPHHSFLIKPIFSAAMSAAPYRKDFVVKLLGPGTSAAELQADLEKNVAALEQQINILKNFLSSPEGKW